MCREDANNAKTALRSFRVYTCMYTHIHVQYVWVPHFTTKCIPTWYIHTVHDMCTWLNFRAGHRKSVAWVIQLYVCA